MKHLMDYVIQDVSKMECRARVESIETLHMMTSLIMQPHVLREIQKNERDLVT